MFQFQAVYDILFDSDINECYAFFIHMKYKNTSSLDQVIPNVGHVAPGATIETNDVIENLNFQLVVDQKEEKKMEPPKATS